MTCPVCLVTHHDLVKIDCNSTCCCCIECLSTHLKRLKSKAEKASCPTCLRECSFCIIDLDKLVDIKMSTGAGDAQGTSNGDKNPEDHLTTAKSEADGEAQARDNADPNPEDHLTTAKSEADGEAQARELDSQTDDEKCKLCIYRNVSIEAESLCRDCTYYLCKDCTAAHPEQKATKNHSLIPLRALAVCATHEEPLLTYCTGCKSAVCKLCINLHHANHEVENLCDTIETKRREGKATLEQREPELRNLQSFKENLKSLNTTVAKLNKRDDLFKKIDDHAQECIDHVVTWKDCTKEQIRGEYKIIEEILKTYAEASDNAEKLKGPVSKMEGLLSESIENPSYLKSLTTTHDDLKAVPQMRGRIDKNYEELFKDFQHRNPTFSPGSLPLPLGKVEINDFYPKLIFSHPLCCDSSEGYIPSVAFLGNERFAIAHPTGDGKQSDTIYVYQLKDTQLLHTLRVDPFLDMSSTFEGNLAVLFERSITIFNPVTEEQLSTLSHKIPNPMSLGVGLENQFIILSSGKEGRGRITVLNNKENGRVDHEMNEPTSTKNPRRVSCSPRYIFIMGDNVDAYEMKYAKIQHSVTLYPGDDGVIKDISASSWDHQGMIMVEHDTKLNNVYLVRCKKNSQKKWDKNHNEICPEVSGADKECRVATRDNYIVVSQGRTFTVYKYKP